MQSSPPTPPTPSSREDDPGSRPAELGAEASSRRRHSNVASTRVYMAQLRAFLEAAEVVDVDPDVIEDLLDGLPDDPPSGGEDGDVDVEDEGDSPDQGRPPPAREQERDQVGAHGRPGRAEERDPEADTDTDEESDEDDVGDEWAAYLQEAQTAWTKQEVKEMKTLLKEKGMAAFITEYVVRRAIPIPRLLYAFNVCLCPELRAKHPRTLMYLLRVALSRELESRERLLTYNTIDDVVRLISSSRRILILTGAGISQCPFPSAPVCFRRVRHGVRVSCGIPDFRSRNGLYASLQENGEYDLDDPQQMTHTRFDIQYFRENPAVFYKIYPSNFIPSPCHRFIKLMEDKGKLLRNYTQNIDTLETLAGVQRVVQCHGSFATASCIHCRVRVPGSEIADDIMNQRVPLCKYCNAAQPPAPPAKGGKKKGKKRKDGWDSDASDEPEPPPDPSTPVLNQVDLLIIIGTSLKVSPVSETICTAPERILINKTPIKHINPDVVLLGNADDIVLHLCNKLGWDLPEVPVPASMSMSASGSAPGPAPGPASNRNLDAPRPNLKKRPSAEFEREPKRVGNSHVWLFEGAEGGRWVEDIERQSLQQAAQDPAQSEGVPAVDAPADERQMKKLRTE
ncbi:DHS-like NAD/FAD-binding domain-containing protein [Trametes polyzona]|nr:DHS-like NAD/FAD-binding domain-containing protein [Trametes polyzona]